MKILIMGLPGAGKTTLAIKLKEALSKQSTVLWLNADKVRELYNDWDFTEEGRLRQARRMHILADIRDEDYVIIDFVCPLSAMRDIVKADFIIWVNTIDKSRYDDTNALFVAPDDIDLEIKDFNYSIDDIIKILRNNYVTSEVSHC